MTAPDRPGPVGCNCPLCDRIMSCLFVSLIHRHCMSYASPSTIFCRPCLHIDHHISQRADVRHESAMNHNPTTQCLSSSSGRVIQASLLPRLAQVLRQVGTSAETICKARQGCGSIAFAGFGPFFFHRPPTPCKSACLGGLRKGHTVGSHLWLPAS